jgi:hypothetical protein
MKNLYKIWAAEIKGSDHLGQLGADRKIILSWITENESLHFIYLAKDGG